MSGRVFITVGEVSGDRNAANLVRELKILRPDLIIEGFGGPAMRDAGVEIHIDTVHRAVMGLRALLRIVEVFFVQRWLRKRYRTIRPDLHVCVDSWSMNWLFARQAKLAGVKVLYYIAPQTWASRPGRVRRLRRYVEQLACIFPFEEEWFRSRDVSAIFVGHPLFDHLAAVRPPRPAIPPDGFASRPPVLALLPGSRSAVARHNLPYLLDVAEIVQRQFPDAQFFIPTTSASQPIAIAQLKRRKKLRNCQLVLDGLDDVAPRCDLAVTVSGTSTLHLASYGVPMIVIYRASRILWELFGRWVIHARTFAMVNILSGTRIVPEFIPWFGPAKEVADAALDLLANPQKLTAQQQSLNALIARLDKPGASRNVAELAMKLMG